MRDVDLDLLRCFATVAELRSFTTAGARLGRSQSAVSIRIKKLEALTGVQLFLRNSQDVHLTENGAALLPKAQRLLDESERLLAELRQPSVSGRLRIGLLEYIAPHRLPEIMSALQRKLPKAELQFQIGLSSSLKTALSKGEIDLALAMHDPDSATSLFMGQDPLVWVTANASEGVTHNETLGLCLLPAPCFYRQAALDCLAKGHLAHRVVMVAASVHSVRDAVRSGLGISVLGASCLGPNLRRASGLSALCPLPKARLGLHGTDLRKAEVASVLRLVLADHLDIGRTPKDQIAHAS